MANSAPLPDDPRDLEETSAHRREPTDAPAQSDQPADDPGAATDGFQVVTDETILHAGLSAKTNSLMEDGTLQFRPVSINLSLDNRNNFGLDATALHVTDKVDSVDPFMHEAEIELQKQGFSNIRILGEGGMGVALYAEETGYGSRPMVIKIPKFKSDTASQETHLEAIRAAFENEKHITGFASAEVKAMPLVEPLKHGEISIEGICIPWIGIKYVKGQTLKAPIESFFKDAARKIPSETFAESTEQFATEIITKVCHAVELLHNGRGKVPGVLHRDIKPGNILVTQDNEIVVLDFGLAVRNDEIRTLARNICGSVGFMSPEQCRAECTTLDRRSDVYAIGAVLYQTLTGAAPFQRGATTAQVINNTANPNTPVPFAKVVQPLANDVLSAIAAKALAKTPSKRYSSAVEMAQDLDRFKKHLPVEAFLERLREKGHRVFGYQIERAWRRNRKRAGVSVAVLLATVAVVFGFGAWSAASAKKTADDKNIAANIQQANDKLVNIRALYDQAIELREKDPNEAREQLVAAITASKSAAGPYRKDEFEKLARFGQLLLEVDQLESSAHLIDRPMGVQQEQLDRFDAATVEVNNYRKDGIELANKESLLKSLAVNLALAKALSLIPSEEYSSTKEENKRRYEKLLLTAEEANSTHLKIIGEESYAAVLLMYRAAKKLELNNRATSLQAQLDSMEMKSAFDYVAKISLIQVKHQSDLEYPEVIPICREGLKLDPTNRYLKLMLGIAYCSSTEPVDQAYGFGVLNETRMLGEYEEVSP